MVPASLEECLGKLQTYRMRYLTSGLEIRIEARGKGVLDNVGTVDQCPLCARTAAFGYYLHFFFESI